MALTRGGRNDGRQEIAGEFDRLPHFHKPSVEERAVEPKPTPRPYGLIVSGIANLISVLCALTWLSIPPNTANGAFVAQGFPVLAVAGTGLVLSIRDLLQSGLPWYKRLIFGLVGILLSLLAFVLYGTFVDRICTARNIWLD